MHPTFPHPPRIPPVLVPPGARRKKEIRPQLLGDAA
jgi:hypothetical protein